MIRASEVVFILFRADVISVAEEMGIPEEAITNDVLENIKKGLEGSDWWHRTIKSAINFALKS
ncbi:MAG: hypothetical protein ACETVS_03095 [Dehalococcoidales bacterium]